jgi:hypothetical protein
MVRVKFRKDPLTGSANSHAKPDQHSGGQIIAVAEQPQQQMFRAHVCVMEGLCLLSGKLQRFLDARRVRQSPRRRVGTDSHQLVDLTAKRLQVNLHSQQDLHGDALSETGYSQKHVFRADVTVPQSHGFLVRESQNLLRARSEVLQR